MRGPPGAAARGGSALAGAPRRGSPRRPAARSASRPPPSPGQGPPRGGNFPLTGRPPPARAGRGGGRRRRRLCLSRPLCLRRRWRVGLPPPHPRAPRGSAEPVPPSEAARSERLRSDGLQPCVWEHACPCVCGPGGCLGAGRGVPPRRPGIGRVTPVDAVPRVTGCLALSITLKNPPPRPALPCCSPCRRGLSCPRT